jgi:hypothetical protein
MLSFDLASGAPPVQIASFYEGVVHGSVRWTMDSVCRLAVWAPQCLLVRAASGAIHCDSARKYEVSSPAVRRRFLDRPSVGRTTTRRDCLRASELMSRLFRLFSYYGIKRHPEKGV